MQLPPLILKEVREARSPQEEESPEKYKSNRFSSYINAAQSKRNISHRADQADTICDYDSSKEKSNQQTLFKLVPIGTSRPPAVHKRKLTADSTTNLFKLSSIGGNSQKCFKSRKSTSSIRLVPRSKFSSAISSSCSSRATTAESSSLSNGHLQHVDRCGYASSMLGVADNKSALSQHDTISDCNQVLLEAELQL